MADAKTVLRAIAHARARLEKYRADLGTLKSTNALWFALNEMTDIATSSQARVEALELFRTVLGWIVERNPFLVRGYVMGHHALDPIVDLPTFLREFPAVDYEGWLEKHGEAMEKAALAAAGEVKHE